ncbi:putative uncharacterized protein [Roseburia sp. CAG:309]|nr:putative uncharacterized protein [Roseburia sp. CAG:309]
MTTVYSDENSDGILDAQDVKLWENVDLRQISVYGDGEEAVYSSVKMTILGGTFKNLYGCGETGTATKILGNVDITMTAGSVSGDFYGLTGENQVEGNLEISISGGTFSGNSSLADGRQDDAKTTVSGGVKADIRGGNWGGNITLIGVADIGQGDLTLKNLVFLPDSKIKIVKKLTSKPTQTANGKITIDMEQCDLSKASLDLSETDRLSLKKQFSLFVDEATVNSASFSQLSVLRNWAGQLRVQNGGGVFMNCGGIAYAYGNYTLERDVEVTKYISIGETTSFTIPYGIHFNINNPSLGGTIAKDVVFYNQGTISISDDAGFAGITFNGIIANEGKISGSKKLPANLVYYPLGIDVSNDVKIEISGERFLSTQDETKKTIYYANPGADLQLSFTESQYEVSAVKYEEKELANIAIGRYNYQYNFQISEGTRQETVLHIVLGKKINELQLVPVTSSVEKNTASQQEEFLVFDMSTIQIANDTEDAGEVTYAFKNAERLNRWGYFFDETNKSRIMADKDCNPLVDYDMEIIVTGKSGKQAEFNLHVSIANQYGLKSGSKVTLKENELVYGDTLEKLEFNQSSISFLKNDNIQQAVSGTICWREPDSVFHVGTHEAVWVFTPDDSEYMPTYGTLKFKVNPVQKENPPAIQAIYGQTLEKLSLPQGYYFKNTGDTPVGNVGTRIFPVYYRSDNADYADTNDLTVQIQVAPLEITKENTKISGLENQTYEGKPVEPQMVVTVNGTTLNSADYTTHYESNNAPGNAAVTLNGIGNYTGSITYGFRIMPEIPKVSQTPVSTPGSNSFQPSSLKTETTGLGGKENSSSNISIKKRHKGEQFETASGAVYRVTKTGKNAAVELMRAKINKNGKLVIPAYVIQDGVKYKVTSIAAKVCYKNTKIKQAKIGKYVKKIGKKAFFKCSNLKKIVIKNKKLKNKYIGKQAFKGIAKKARIIWK